jgi:predicted nucleotidyltransferase
MHIESVDPERMTTRHVFAGPAPVACKIPILGINMPIMGKRAKQPRKVTGPAKRLSISNALFSRTQQRVLGFLFGQPERSFFASELIQLSGSGSGAVQRELARLSASGLITSKEVGRQRHYQANREAPIFEELRLIVMKTGGIAEILRGALAPISKQVQRAFVYGSVAKGTATAASDIDILVVAEGLPLEQLFSALASAESRLGRKISPLLLLPHEFKARNESGNPFLRTVLTGPTIPLIGTPGSDSPTQ